MSEIDAKICSRNSSFFYKSIIERLGVYLLLLSIFCISFSMNAPILILPNFVMGFILLIWIPGTEFRKRLFADFDPIGLNVFCGIVLNIIFIQIQFLLSYLFGFKIFLVLWLAIMNAFLVSSYSIVYRKQMPLEMVSMRIDMNMLRKKYSTDILAIAFLGILIRCFFWYLGQDSFSPDAGMYFDYARHLLVGEFNSNLLNDGAIITLNEFVGQITHQSTAYLFSLSMILVPSYGYSPVVLQIIMGQLLAFGCYEILKHFLDREQARIGLLLASLHPTLVYFSSISYGPSMFSLVILTYVILLLVTIGRDSSSTLAFVGFLIVLIESIWYANLFVLIVILVFGRLFQKTRNLKRMFLFGISFLLVILARQLVTNLLVYFTIVVVLLISFPLLDRFENQIEWKSYFPLFFSIFIFFELFYLPMQLSAIANAGTRITIAGNIIVYALSKIPNTEYFFLFSQFILWHISALIVIGVIISLLVRKNRETTYLLGSVLVFCTIGTFLVMSYIEPLEPAYLYTSARFLLVPIVIGILLASIGVDGIQKQVKSLLSKIEPNRLNSTVNLQASGFVLLILVGSFAPGYFLGIENLGFVTPESRYGWQGITEYIDGIGNQSSVFLVDRAREFAWLTNRITVSMQLSKIGLTDANASKELLNLTERYCVDYIIIDDYTFHHWKTFEWLYLDPIPLGGVVAFNLTSFIDNTQGYVISHQSSLKLVAENKPDEHSSHMRVFELISGSYNVSHRLDILNGEWNASNEGYLTNTTEGIELSIGPGQYYTNTWRPSGFDLDMDVPNGFITLNLESIGAEIVRISFWDDNGVLLRYGQKLNDTLYYANFGNITIGDIRIVIEGIPGSSILIKSVLIWELEAVS